MAHLHEPAADRLMVEDEAARAWQCNGCGRWNPEDERDCRECGPKPCGDCESNPCACDAADEVGDDGRPL